MQPQWQQQEQVHRHQEQMRLSQEQQRRLQEQMERSQQHMKDLRDLQQKQMYWEQEQARKRKAELGGSPSGTGLQPLSPQLRSRQPQYSITTSDHVFQSETHPVRGVLVFLVCLALTLVLGAFIGGIFNSMNAAAVAWVIGLLFTLQLTQRVWRGE